ncbi:tannase/feruloyl esterase family alpha/beta hydrolase [Caldimonas tepidiphila]|uniref:tannase/feruloyl esterase family alpha/beta hydrolase n=1 Tax=Caldimonas tepidiphila TaxID=2315841 RepID=UPI001F0B7BF2|nr:tannase/feruloyl esterase family alpha/beta hydrolase [Caldimonas tepidiphila]
MKRITPVAAAAAIAALLAGCGGSDDPAPAVATPQQACESLAGLQIPASAIGLRTSGAVVQKATFVEAGAKDNVNGEYCAVTGLIIPVSAAAPNTEFQVNLPTQWNAKALQMGGGAYNGTLVTGLGKAGLQPDTVARPLKQGYVTLGSDGGHKGGPGFDGSFGMNDEALLNYGKESIKKTHDVAMAVVKARYGKTPARFYFIGNSQGGHEALDAAARYPADYDGVVANYPAYNVTLLHLGSLNVGKAIYSNGGAGWLSPAKTKLLTDAVYAACDPLDGVRDGIISNVAACNDNFNVSTLRSGPLRCAGGGDTGDTCLSDAQIAAVEKITSPYRPGFPIAGMDEFPRWPLLEGALFQVSSFGSRPVPGNPPTGADALLYNVGSATSRYIITRDLALDAMAFDPLQWQARTQEVGTIMDVTDIDLSAFRRKGGKIIMTHGTADDFITPHNSVAYYNRHLALQGKDAMDSFMRFYMIPGLGHGFGPFNAKYDGLAELDRWVETGRAPGVLTAVDENAPATNKGSRPMCLYPTWPKFTGAGTASPNDAANYTCVAS